MAAGRMIVAATLGSLLVVLLVGNVRCTGGSDAAPRTPGTPGGAGTAGIAEAPGSPGSAESDPPLAQPRGAAGAVTDRGPADAAPAAPGTGDGEADPAADVASAGPDDGVERVTVEIAGESFHLELAADPGTRVQGLMGRTEIARDGGMLFVFPDVAMRSFWMKDCLTDMDIIFLDGSGRVTATHEMTMEPPRRPDESQLAYELRLPGYSSLRPAQFAIELAPGSLDRLGVRTGDLIRLDLDALKRRAR